MPDITSLSGTDIEQDVTDVSSQFSLDIEDPSKADGEIVQLISAVGGADVLGPYMDLPLGDEWLSNYQREREEAEHFRMFQKEIC